MLDMHDIPLSNDKTIRTLLELERFLMDLSGLNIEELQHISTSEPLRVR